MSIDSLSSDCHGVIFAYLSDDDHRRVWEASRQTGTLQNELSWRVPVNRLASIYDLAAYPEYDKYRTLFGTIIDRSFFVKSEECYSWHRKGWRAGDKIIANKAVLREERGTLLLTPVRGRDVALPKTLKGRVIDYDRGYVITDSHDTLRFWKEGAYLKFRKPYKEAVKRVLISENERFFLFEIGNEWYIQNFKDPNQRPTLIKRPLPSVNMCKPRGETEFAVIGNTCYIFDTYLSGQFTMIVCKVFENWTFSCTYQHFEGSQWLALQEGRFFYEDREGIKGWDLVTGQSCSGESYCSMKRLSLANGVWLNSKLEPIAIIGDTLFGVEYDSLSRQIIACYSVCFYPTAPNHRKSGHHYSEVVRLQTDPLWMYKLFPHMPYVA